jgi:hypothetical protein
MLLDGTWNDSDFSETDTNIVRLRDAIAQTLHVSEGTTTNPGDLVSSITFQQKENVVFYERGVGTSAFLDRWIGGAFGEGLTKNIRRAYKFLSFFYNAGDRIFIFGFSRGAYTARSLAGYIHAAGLLKRDECNEDLEAKAWDFYQTPPNDRLPGIWSSLTPHVHPRGEVKIACLGLFDTVGALGIPLSAFRVANRDKYEFHDVELSSITDLNLHALAIDELREPFEAAVWRRSKFKQINTKTEHVWFAGSHADLGGGYTAQESRPKVGFSGLDDITLSWMIKRLKARYADFPIVDFESDEARSNPEEAEQRAKILAEMRARAAIAEQHNPRKGLYYLMPRALRSIANIPVATRRVRFVKSFGEVNVSRDRHATAHREMVHISAIERLGQKVKINGRIKTYAPRNLLAVFQNIRSGLIGASDPPIDVVDWDGNVIASGGERAKQVDSFMADIQNRLKV